MFKHMPSALLCFTLASATLPARAEPVKQPLSQPSKDAFAALFDARQEAWESLVRQFSVGCSEAGAGAVVGRTRQPEPRHARSGIDG